MKASNELLRLGNVIENADAVLIGAGAGLSVVAGYTYAGERFQKHFADFERKYHFHDMYSGGFFPYPTEEEKWAFWSRNIYCNRYDQPKSAVHEDLLHIVEDKEYFVLTTNVDHLFQNNGFSKERLFYTQGDYGLWQCKTPCHEKTYDNEEAVRHMREVEKDMHIPTELVPKCPICGGAMEMNLHCDDTFVEDEGWLKASKHYRKFLQHHKKDSILYFELGVGMNTPGIIKFPFWYMTVENPDAIYATINQEEATVPEEIKARSICIKGDIREALALLAEHRN